MKKHGVKPEEINLEITESAVIHDEKAMQTFLASMRKIGFSFALDDFGTGNANFSYVMKYPFRLLKIDKSFLWGAEKEASARAILDCMLELTQGIGRDAVVEGVETKAQRDYLVGRKVRYLQGYYYSKPIPEQDFLHFLENFNRRAGTGMMSAISLCRRGGRQGCSFPGNRAAGKLGKAKRGAEENRPFPIEAQRAIASFGGSGELASGLSPISLHRANRVAIPLAPGRFGKRKMLWQGTGSGKRSTLKRISHADRKTERTDKTRPRTGG